MKVRGRVSDNLQTTMPSQPANMPQEYYDLMAHEAGRDSVFSESYEDNLIRNLLSQDDMLKLKAFSRQALQRFSGPPVPQTQQVMEQLLAEPSSWKTTVRRAK